MTDSILITGASGLLGRAMLARLASRRRVYALVRPQSQMRLPGEAAIIEHDLHSQRKLELAEAPDTIVHLAQSPHHHAFPDSALDVFEVNVASTQRLLDFAWRRGVKRFIYASSGGVYGYGEHAFFENTPQHLDGKLGPYLAGKQYCEGLAQAYGGHMIIVILRFFFMYGPGQRASMLMPRLINNVLHGRPLLLQGQDGLRTNPIYVDDAAAAVERATALNTSETINIAGPQVLNLREIGTLIGGATSCVPLFEVQPDAMPKSLIGDTTKMAAMLAAPMTSFEDGIRRVIATIPAEA